MPPPRNLPRWTRSVIVAAIALMGGALIAMLWSTQRGVQAASTLMVRGQASEIHATVRTRLGEMIDDPIDQRVAAAFEAAGADGLVYIAALDSDLDITAEAGAPSADRAALTRWARDAPVAQPVRTGDRYRVVYRRTRARANRPDRPDRPNRSGRWPGLVLELKPRLSDELGATATWSLAIGAIAAATLLLLTAVLVRWSLRREESVRAVEQARHLATLGQMSAVLAHEIRNPLASLKGNAQLLAQSLPAGERPRTKADRVVDEASRLEQLTNDLLAFARTGRVDRTDTDPGALLRGAADAVDGARIAVATDGAPPRWPLDADRMRQVLVNLLENAIELSDGPVDARVGRDGGELVFTIRDRGPGLAEADLDHIFEPFYTRRTRGTGLGLAVCKRLVELHHGTITATNASGGGAEFRIAVPRK